MREIHMGKTGELNFIRSNFEQHIHNNHHVTFFHSYQLQLLYTRMYVLYLRASILFRQAKYVPFGKGLNNT